MKVKISIIGLGYVGLPLAAQFAKYYRVVGYDLNKKRVDELNNFHDKTNEIKKIDLKKVSRNLLITNDLRLISESNIFIITVPTPIKKNKSPDLNFIKKACLDISKYLTNQSIVVLESTVYPGLTHDFCVPILEKNSGLKYLKYNSKKNGFFMGYSPERINPGDKKHTISKIKKIVSSSNIFALKKLVQIYSKIIKAGIYSVNNIEIAEAAKVIENTQRDINIALINEFAIIFDKLKINSGEVLKAANTKWNFLPFKPGLVGGHCIGVDPYYLTHIANKKGYIPKIITSGRSLNNNMPAYIISRLSKKMKEKKITLKNSKILILGLTFKENCPDIRNSGVIELNRILSKSAGRVEIYDPYVSMNDIRDLKINIIDKLKQKKYDILIYAVNHNIFKKFNMKMLRGFLKKNNVIFDLKNVLPPDQIDESL
ncbi:nucleotide sugar dehydrogenase [Pelagibacteraceae bacterium]|nr:nucleotide sugar dehydrogenase [Pelagibacteraceae bacterium]